MGFGLDFRLPNPRELGCVNDRPDRPNFLAIAIKHIMSGVMARFISWGCLHVIDSELDPTVSSTTFFYPLPASTDN